MMRTWSGGSFLSLILASDLGSGGSGALTGPMARTATTMTATAVAMATVTARVGRTVCFSQQYE